MFLLDTSVLTRLRAQSILQRIEELDRDGLARTSMTDLEIGFSARNADEWDRLQVALGAFRRIDVEAHHFDRAQQVQRNLAADGHRGRKVPDLLIAAVAEATSLTVLHYDADFDHIAAVTGQPTQWIVERGSIDSSAPHDLPPSKRPPLDSPPQNHGEHDADRTTSRPRCDVTEYRGFDGHYAVIQEGLDPFNGKEKRAWHPAGPDKAAAERLAKRLAAEAPGRDHKTRSLTLSAYLNGQWHPPRPTRWPSRPGTATRRKIGDTQWRTQEKSAWKRKNSWPTPRLTRAFVGDRGRISTCDLPVMSDELRPGQGHGRPRWPRWPPVRPR